MPVLVNLSCSCLMWQQRRDANRAQEEWFGNAASFQNKTGLFDPQPPLTNHEVAFGASPECSLQGELHRCCTVYTAQSLACFVHKLGSLVHQTGSGVVQQDHQSCVLSVTQNKQVSCTLN